MLILKLLIFLSFTFIAHSSFAAKDSNGHKEHTQNHFHQENDSHNKEKELHKEHKGHDDHHEEEEHVEGHEENENSSNVGPEKAITFANEKSGISLSEKAMKNLNLKFYKVEGQDSQYEIPLSALVFNRDKVSIYRHRENIFKLLNVDIIHTNNKENTVKITTSELTHGDEVVSQNVGLLRIAELQAFGASGHGHGH